MTQRFEGRNLDEALNHAASALGVDRYRIVHKVLVEKRGFLGGVKRIVIEAEVSPESEAPPPPQPVFTPTAPPQRSPERGRGPRREGGGRSGGSRSGGSRSGSRGGGSRHEERDDRGGRRRRGGRPDYERPPEQEDQSPFAVSVADWVEELCDIAEFDLEVRTTESEEQLLVDLYGSDARRFTARNGELLDSIQTIANKAFTDKEGYKQLEFDAQSFKKQRNEAIGEEARRLADIVREQGREQLLPSMTPFERRIVHVTLSEDADVMTESRGEGFFKRVAILPRPHPPTPES
jgi:spoIIIJ-associated protein